MGLREEILQLPFDARFSYDDSNNTLFLNFSELTIKTQADVERFMEKIRSIVGPLGHGVTRFTTSAFMRAKLGDALAKRGVAPHIFESEAEAKDVVRATIPRA